MDTTSSRYNFLRHHAAYLIPGVQPRLASQLLTKLADARSWAQMLMAAVQEGQEEYATRYRQAALVYEVG
jgi:hypothetical protein